jgi:hypothetical protein
VAKAKVPIIKFEEVASGFNFDISFDVANGPVTAAFVRELMAKLPAMRPLLFILKIFLQQREMNEVQDRHFQPGLCATPALIVTIVFTSVTMCSGFQSFNWHDGSALQSWETAM